MLFKKCQTRKPGAALKTFVFMEFVLQSGLSLSGTIKQHLAVTLAARPVLRAQ